LHVIEQALPGDRHRLVPFAMLGQLAASQQVPGAMHIAPQAVPPVGLGWAQLPAPLHWSVVQGLPSDAQAVPVGLGEVTVHSVPSGSLQLRQVPWRQVKTQLV
jgi:hypothetical protein